MPRNLTRIRNSKGKWVPRYDGGPTSIEYRPRRWARRLHASFKRFASLLLHRRAGKTVAFVNHNQRAALDDKWETKRLRYLKPDLTDEEIKVLLKNRVYAHIFPTRNQAKQVAWRILKDAARNIPRVKINETELSVTYPNGCVSRLFGADNPDSLRGLALSGAIFDEFSQQDPRVFSEVVSKALGDHLGYVIFGGTIKGTDHLYDTHLAAKKNPDRWLMIYQNVDESLATESGPTIRLLEQAMEDDRKSIDEGIMTQQEFDQEWFLSPDAAIAGAFYAKQMDAARNEKRIGRVAYDPTLPVDTDWDIGTSDHTAIWFTQRLRTGEVRVIDYYENTGEGIPHYAKVLKDKKYLYGEHWGPHDIAHTEWGTGMTRIKTAAQFGIRFQACPMYSREDGIHAVRMLLPRCVFDEVKTKRGLECLRKYRKRYNSSLKEFTGDPVHDVFSHGADAFRTLACRIQQPMLEERHRRRKTTGNPFEDDKQNSGRSWMS